MIENSLDEKNTELYNSLKSAGVQFDSIIDTNFNSWAVQPVYKFKIVANNAEPSPSSLTHELLHIYCNVNGFVDTFTIIDIFKSNNTRFKTECISDIQNLLAHLKMFPFFLKLGYNINEFYLNYGDKLIRETLIPNFITLGVMFKINKELNSKPSIDVITTFFQLVLILKQIEMEEDYQQIKNQSSEYSELLIGYDEELFNTFNGELNAWLGSETFSNYDFYININEKLQNLGYPIENEWEAWMYNNKT